MYLKRVVILCLFIWMTLGFSLSAYAAPDENANDFFNTFDINQNKLAENAADGNLGLYAVKDGVSILQKTDDSINNYKVLVLNNGYNKLSVVTFSGTKILSGKGEEETLVGVNVFNVSKEGNIINSNPSIQKIGASGVYNATIDLKTGDNSVVIAAKKGDLILYRLFKVTVKQEETKGALENIQIVLIPDKSSTDTKPSQGAIIKQVIGAPVVDSLTK